MHIPAPIPGFLDRPKAEQELEQLLGQPTARELRPCPGCQLPCNPVVPADCATNCDSDCENAPMALSSDPDKHPIEQYVVAIVFELTTLRLIQPCWSCEGHLNGQGELWKLPQISFYSTSALYPKLILDYLNRLKYQNQLNYPWQINMVDYGQTWSPTYQMEPALNQTREEVKLALLQHDLSKIAEGLAEKIKQEARTMLARIQRA